MGKPVTSHYIGSVHTKMKFGSWPFVAKEGWPSVETSATLKGPVRVSAAEGMREAGFAGLGMTVSSEWMFASELASGKVQAVLNDWSLPSIDLWDVFPTGRQASVKARAFVTFIEARLFGKDGVSSGASTLPAILIETVHHTRDA